MVLIPGILLTSWFPDRAQIKVNRTLNELVEVDLSQIFKYNSATSTLSHLTFPEFDLTLRHNILFWYISKSGETDRTKVNPRLKFFQEYIVENNLMPNKKGFLIRFDPEEYQVKTIDLKTHQVGLIKLSTDKIVSEFKYGSLHDDFDNRFMLSF